MVKQQTSANGANKSRILALVGLKGSGKSTAARYFSGRGVPTVETTADTLRSVRDLLAAGQKLVVLDGVVSAASLAEVKHEFPGMVKVMAVVAPKQVRHQRLMHDEKLMEAEVLEFDRIEIEEMGQGKVVAGADEFVVNDGGVGEMHRKLRELLRLPTNGIIDKKPKNPALYQWNG